jgi:dihydroneopterin aldolase
MKRSNLKVVKLDKNKSLFNYEKKILIKELTLDLKLGYYEFEKRETSKSKI